MADEHRVTIRLTPDVYALLEARGSRGLPLAAIVREALIDYLTRQPAPAQSPENLADTVAAMAASLDDLRSQVAVLSARLDTLAAISSQPAASAQQPAADVAARARQPAGPTEEPAPASARPLARGQRKLTPRQIRALRDKHLRGVSVEALQDEYGVSRASVFRYLRSSQRRESTPPAADTPPTGTATPGPQRRSGRPPGPLRQQILALLQAHPEGLRAEELRVYLQTPRPIGDTLQGMRKGGVITVQGRGTERRYVATAPAPHDQL